MTENIYKLITDEIKSFRQEMTSRFDKMEDRFEKIECNYVRKEDFQPIKNVVYGMIGFILIAFLGGLTALVIKKDFAFAVNTTKDIVQVAPMVNAIGVTLNK